MNHGGMRVMDVAARIAAQRATRARHARNRFAVHAAPHSCTKCTLPVSAFVPVSVAAEQAAGQALEQSRPLFRRARGRGLDLGGFLVRRPRLGRLRFLLTAAIAAIVALRGTRLAMAGRSRRVVARLLPLARRPAITARTAGPGRRILPRRTLTTLPATMAIAAAAPAPPFARRAIGASMALAGACRAIGGCGSAMRRRVVLLLRRRGCRIMPRLAARALATAGTTATAAAAAPLARRRRT